MPLKKFFDDNDLLAIVVSSQWEKRGTKFITEDKFCQQLAFINYDKGHIIESHIHTPQKREINYTCETLIIKSGKVRVDVYNDKKVYKGSCVLGHDDIIMFFAGGHGFEIIDDAKMLEIKQGPYVEYVDKERFAGIKKEDIRLL